MVFEVIFVSAPSLEYYLVMIARIEGKIIEKTNSLVVIDVSGIGYRIFVSSNTLSDIGKKKEISLWTHLVVRENLMDLYGFSKKEERNFFELLINISGIGPKGALGILSLAPVETLEKAIASEDASYLTKVSGIGKKSAQKIVLELKDKLEKVSDGDSLGLKEKTEALEALKALGYSTSDSREALKKIPAEVTGTNEKIKEALKIFGNG